MKRLLLTLVLLQGTSAAVAAPAIAIEEAQGALAGTYSDDGMRVGGEGAAGKTASLHALVCLEFDPAAAAKLHELTAKVVVTQGNGALKVEVFDRDDVVIHEGTWPEGGAYQRQGDRATLLFKGAGAAASYRLILEPVADRKLLQVEVQRVEATTFGPVVTPLGTYVFGRI